MQSFIVAVRSARTRCYGSSKISDFSSVSVALGFESGNGVLRSGIPAPGCVRVINASSCSSIRNFASSLYSMAAERCGFFQCPQFNENRLPLLSALNKKVGAGAPQCSSSLTSFRQRSMSTVSTDASDPAMPVVQRIKFKRLDKTARNIMQILDREAVAEAKSQRETFDIQPGYTIQMKVVSLENKQITPDNKPRVRTITGIVIARRNAGLNTTFRVRSLVSGVGVEHLFPLYSPNIKEVRVLDKKKFRRAKLYYLRDRINPLKTKKKKKK